MRNTLVGFAVVVSTASIADDSSADKSFTMKMEESQRAQWEKSFNELLAKPFATKLTCTADSTMVLQAGSGCVELSKDEKLCCDAFNIKLACDDGAWKQTSIDANSCRESE